MKSAQETNTERIASAHSPNTVPTNLTRTIIQKIDVKKKTGPGTMAGERKKNCTAKLILMASFGIACKNKGNFFFHAEDSALDGLPLPSPLAALPELLS
jgi:hypothetical protein